MLYGFVSIPMLYWLFKIFKVLKKTNLIKLVKIKQGVLVGYCLLTYLKLRYKIAKIYRSRRAICKS